MRMLPIKNIASSCDSGQRDGETEELFHAWVLYCFS
jgi:hypothetical protein